MSAKIVSQTEEELIVRIDGVEYTVKTHPMDMSEGKLTGGDIPSDTFVCLGDSESDLIENIKTQIEMGAANATK